MDCRRQAPRPGAELPREFQASRCRVSRANTRSAMRQSDAPCRRGPASWLKLPIDRISYASPALPIEIFKFNDLRLNVIFHDLKTLYGTLRLSGSDFAILTWLH